MTLKHLFFLPSAVWILLWLLSELTVFQFLPKVTKWFKER